jgi:hypothetical protein
VSNVVVQVLRALERNDSSALEQAVPQADYRLALVRLARNVIPSGSALTEVEVRTAADSPSEAVYLRPAQRRAASEAIKMLGPPRTETEAEQGTIEGILRALSLDNTWLEIRTESGSQKVRIGPNELDDVIGPMVNRRVAARVHFAPAPRRGGRTSVRLIDIELLED